MNCTGIAFVIAVITCEAPPPPVSDTARFCQTYQPTPWRRRLATTDPDTLEVIKRNNAAWNRLCRRSR